MTTKLQAADAAHLAIHPAQAAHFSTRAAQAALLTIRAAGAAALLSICLAASMPQSARADERDGVVHVTSLYTMPETIRRIKADVAAKGIRFFAEIDQSGLAREAGIELRPSTLLIFGNPPLGTQFLTANPDAGLDWPVRVLVHEDGNGTVSIAYTDFDWIAHRYAISGREAQFAMATSVIGSIAANIASR
jgi:uncharacterized protein (DUF302 family)